jgi:hypothetical protein
MEPLNMMERALTALCGSALLISVAGCEQKPKLVYVPVGPQTVTLVSSASTTRVQQGSTVVLSVQRQLSGNWQQVPLSEVRGQCWLHRPPPSSEPEVADNVQWAVDPENSVTFNTEYRFDHTRIATMNMKGTVTLTPASTVACEPDRLVQGSPILIEVG